MPTFPKPTRFGALLAALAVGLVVAACSSNSTPTTTTTTMPSQSASRAAIKQSFGVLFDLANPALAPKIAVIQDGSALKVTMRAALASPLAKEAVGATISKVQIESSSACSDGGVPSPCAKVTYDILGPGGTALLANSQGYAVYSRSHWLVAKETICSLLYFENGDKVAPGCS